MQQIQAAAEVAAYQVVGLFLAQHLLLISLLVALPLHPAAVSTAAVMQQQHWQRQQQQRRQQQQYRYTWRASQRQYKPGWL
jgi:hypothetical protein